METPRNPNAFPACNEAAVNETMGMTLRDYFAGQALAGIISIASAGFSLTPEDEARWAYERADAMLKAREGE